MSASLPHSFALVFPLCGLGLLVGGIYLTSNFVPPPEVFTEQPQRKPRWANPHQLVVLRRQYCFYQSHRNNPEMAQQATALYDQIVSDSDPSALDGTDLPKHL